MSTATPHVYQAITTRYLGPTNYKGARIKAECDRGSITVSYDYGLSDTGRHVAARQALVDKFCAEDLKHRGEPIDKNPWNRAYTVGVTKSGEHVHVSIPT